MLRFNIRHPKILPYPNEKLPTNCTAATSSKLDMFVSLALPVHLHCLTMKDSSESDKATIV